MLQSSQIYERKTPPKKRPVAFVLRNSYADNDSIRRVVDGISYEYLGTGSQDLPTLQHFKIAKPKSVSYDSQYSNFTFRAGAVEILASFFSPVTPKDICRTSIPLSYLTTSVRSLDGQKHHVQFYSDVNGAWISNDSSAGLESSTCFGLPSLVSSLETMLAEYRVLLLVYISKLLLCKTVTDSQTRNRTVEVRQRAHSGCRWHRKRNRLSQYTLFLDISAPKL